MMLRPIHGGCSLGLFWGFCVGLGCWNYSANHCANLDGNASCAERGGYCNSCEAVNDGCTSVIPPENCYYPGIVEGSGGYTPSGTASTTGVGGDGTTLVQTSTGVAENSESSEGTSMLTDEAEAGTAGEQSNGYSPCIRDEDCAEPFDRCISAATGYTTCTLDCLSDDDCPPAVDAGAGIVVMCHETIDVCFLECEQDITGCPRGMECSPGALGSFCLWPY